MNKFSAALITCAFMLCSCIGLGQHGRSDDSGDISLQGVLGYVHDAIDALNNKVNSVDQTRLLIEQVTGPIDTDGDGRISPAESKAAAAKLAASKDPRAADLLLNPDAWILLGGSYLGMHGVKSGGMAAVKVALGKLADHVNERNNAANDDKGSA